jgi:hypothetical protein
MAASKLFPQAQRKANRIQQRYYRKLKRRTGTAKTRAITREKLEAVRRIRRNMRLLEAIHERDYRIRPERSDRRKVDDFARFAELVFRFSDKFGEERLARLERVFIKDGFFSYDRLKKLLSGDRNAFESRCESGLKHTFGYRNVILEYLMGFATADELDSFLDRIEVSSWGSQGSCTRGLRLAVAIREGRVPELVEEIERHMAVVEARANEMAKVRKERADKIEEEKKEKRKTLEELVEVIEQDPLLQSMILLIPEGMSAQATLRNYMNQEDIAELFSMALKDDVRETLLGICEDYLGIKPKDGSFPNLMNRMKIVKGKLRTYEELRDYWEGQMTEQELRERQESKGIKLLEINGEKAIIELPPKGNVVKSRDSISRSRMGGGIDYCLREQAKLTIKAAIMLKARLKL